MKIQSGQPCQSGLEDARVEEFFFFGEAGSVGDGGVRGGRYHLVGAHHAGCQKVGCVENTKVFKMMFMFSLLLCY